MVCSNEAGAVNSRYDSGVGTGPSTPAKSQKKTGSRRAGRLTVLLSWCGALVSVAVMSGVGYWATNLSSRDPSDIPVVRSMEGHARTRPIDPGGLSVENQGLSINQVIESGIAAEASDTIILAPGSMPLQPEDMVRTGAKATPTNEPNTIDASSSDVVEVLGLTDTQQAEVSVDEVEPVVEPALVAEPAEDAPNAATLPRPRPNAIKIASLRDGTLVVHLGSYGSYETAEEERRRLIDNHGDLIGNRPTMIQPTEDSGVTSYKIAAVGFEDRVASRNLCTSLLERGTQCIPVQKR